MTKLTEHDVRQTKTLAVLPTRPSSLSAAYNDPPASVCHGVSSSSHQVSLSPHQMLRNYVSQAMPNARLMHELLLYERYKREVHAHRNRRLFDRTRAARRLEEENRELKRQVRRGWWGEGG